MAFAPWPHHTHGTATGREGGSQAGCGRGHDTCWGTARHQLRHPRVSCYGTDLAPYPTLPTRNPAYPCARVQPRHAGAHSMQGTVLFSIPRISPSVPTQCPQEMNDGDQTCRFLQLWITPDRRGHVPQYGSSQYDKADRHNRLLHILGGTGAIPSWPSVHSPNSIKLNQVGEGRARAALLQADCLDLGNNKSRASKPSSALLSYALALQLYPLSILFAPPPQDANVFVSENDPGTRFDVPLGAGRQAYVVCIEGEPGAGGQET